MALASRDLPARPLVVLLPARPPVVRYDSAPCDPQEGLS